MVRLLFSSSSRAYLFKVLKEEQRVKTLNQLAEKLKTGKSTVRKWRYAEIYMPDKIIPCDLISHLEIVDSKPDNWGRVKGGLSGGLDKARLLHKHKMLEGCRKGGQHAVKKLREWCKNNGSSLSQFISQSKLKKTEQLVKRKEEENSRWFVNNKVSFDTSGVTYSTYDQSRGLKLPSILTPLLAEEIGMHIGDGCLSRKKYYYSLRGDVKEKKYYADFVLPTYKTLFSLNLSLLERPPICGFEVSSRGLYEFKRDVVGLPIGEKVNKIDVPACILDSKDKEILISFIRGVFDTDGCVYFLQSRKYPRIQLEIKSKKIIDGIKQLLDNLGFMVAVDDCRLVLNGPVMFNKWANQIGSNNPKHLRKIQKIKKELLL